MSDAALAFSQAVPDKAYSMAFIQGFLMKYKTSYRAALENVGDLEHATAADLGLTQPEEDQEEEEQ